MFALATFLVAPRGSDEGTGAGGAAGLPRESPIRGAVRPLDLPPELREIASSTVRVGLAEGGRPDETVPPVVASFMEATGLYADEARYRARLRRLGLLADA